MKQFKVVHRILSRKIIIFKRIIRKKSLLSITDLLMTETNQFIKNIKYDTL